MAEQTVPVLPVTVPAFSGGGYSGSEGFCAKDASFLSSLHTSLTDQTAHRDNIVAVLENKFQTERGQRDIIQLVERLERENQRVVYDVQTAVLLDGEKTRSLIQADMNGRGAKELADLKLELILLKNEHSSTT